MPVCTLYIARIVSDLYAQRHLNAVTSSWRGLDTLISLTGGDSLSDAVRKDYDVPELQQHPFLPLASLCLTDPNDPRYKVVMGYREQLGRILDASATSLRAEKTEDHTDAVSCKYAMALRYPLR